MCQMTSCHSWASNSRAFPGSQSKEGNKVSYSVLLTRKEEACRFHGEQDFPDTKLEASS